MIGRIRAIAACAAMAVLLGGCAHPQLLDMGAADASIVAELGAPDARVALADGRTRLVYSEQASAQEVWWLTLGSDGRLEGRENAMDRAHFALVRPGVSTEEDVWNLFGRCAEKREFALSNKHAWMYRFKDEGLFDMACWVEFNPQGVVVEVGYTLDPWRDRNPLFLF